MANDRILSSAEAFEQAVSQFNSCMEELQNSYLQMSGAVFMLDSTWNGEASVAFKEKFEELAAKLATSDRTIETAVNDIQKVVAGHAEITDEISSLFNAASDTTDPFSAG